MYNRYIPQNSRYTPVEGAEQPGYTETGEQRKSGRRPVSELLKKLRFDALDSGDILLLLIILLLWKESEDTELLLALGGAMLLGDGEG